MKTKIGQNPIRAPDEKNFPCPFKGKLSFERAGKEGSSF